MLGRSASFALRCLAEDEEDALSLVLVPTRGRVASTAPCSSVQAGKWLIREAVRVPADYGCSAAARQMKVATVPAAHKVHSKFELRSCCSRAS